MSSTAKVTKTFSKMRLQIDLYVVGGFENSEKWGQKVEGQGHAQTR